MKIFYDNQCDDATVSEAAETVNYPASNVQDSRLSRIFRGGESVDFDMDGGGELKNISQAYTNLIQDPTDLTTVNWALVNDATATSSSETFLGLPMTKIGSTTSTADPRITQTVTVTSGVNVGHRLVLRNLNHTVSGTDDTTIFGITAGIDINISINWVTKVVTETAGIIKYVWVDDETIMLDLISALTSSTSYQFRIDPIAAGDSTKFLYATACQVVNFPGMFYPYYDGAKTADSIDETFTLPDRCTIDLIVTPFFYYNFNSDRILLSYGSGSNELYIVYDVANDKFFVAWQDGGTIKSISSQQFDNGSSFTDLNQRIRFTASLDLVSGGINDSRFIVTPLESGAINEDTSWTGVPDTKTTDFSTLSIGHDAGGSQANCEYEYLRFYEGLLVGTVTASDDITELLKAKKILLDKTYSQTLTATDLLIAGSTINDGDTITLRGNDVDSFSTGSPVDETVTWSKDITTHTFTKASHQYWRLSVNSSNIIDLGRIFLGESYSTAGISPSVTHTRNSASLKTISASGQSYLDERYFSSKISITWAALTHTQKQALIDIFDDVDIGKPFFITFDETEIDLDTVYVTIDGENITFSLLVNPDYYSAGINLIEEV
jgi:hypothetical protein